MSRAILSVHHRQSQRHVPASSRRFQSRSRDAATSPPVAAGTAESRGTRTQMFGARPYRSIALIEIAEAIEALLQVLRASSLLLPNGRARDESAPAEVRHAVVFPSWSSQIATELAIGVCLDHSDPGVDFAARPLAFHVCAWVVPPKSEILRARGQGRSKSCDGRKNDSTADSF
jgi:hypothetical protein